MGAAGIPAALHAQVGGPIEMQAPHFQMTPVLPVPKIAATKIDIAAKVKRDAQMPRWLPALVF